jgi:hypothetical protein
MKSILLERTNFVAQQDQDGKTVYGPSGKYEFYKDEKGILHCKRYGKEWRDFVGDKAVTALFDYALQLSEAVDTYHKEEVERRLKPFI